MDKLWEKYCINSNQEQPTDKMYYEGFIDALTEQKEMFREMVEVSKDVGETCLQSDIWKDGHRLALDHILKELDSKE